MRKIFLAVSAILFICVSLNAQSFAVPGFSTNNIGSNWVLPMGTVFSKDGLKLFVWEKGGKVFVCNRNADGLYTKQTTPVLDISTEVGNWADHGLNGFALDPEFNANGLVYLLYAVDRRFLMNDNSIPADKENVATIGRVTRYQLIADGSLLTTDLASRTILIGETPSTGIPVLHDSHGMGNLIFASDGTLLASAGDGATYNGPDPGSEPATFYLQALADGIIRPNENVGSFRAQMINSHNGKILRINPANGNGMSSNPFYNAAAPRSPQSRVWALGLRNPFRFNVRPGTGSTNPSAGDIGEIYVGDVGWRTYEELNIIKSAGMNCGWPLYEGLTPTTPVASEASYASFGVLNMDEPNPLYGGSCSQQYFSFNQLLKQARPDNNTDIYNPCNGSWVIPSTHPLRFVHHRPAIDWQQFVNNTRVPTFTGDTATTAMVGTTPSGVEGNPYPGNCSVGGIWYTGNLFPPQYRNTYLHIDFGAGWIKSYKVDYTDVVTKVQNFGSGFSSLSCITENPIDGTLIYTDVGLNQVKCVTYGGNQYPVVNVASDKTYGTSSLDVSLSGSNSFDPEGGSLTYSWNFGDSTPISTAADVLHTFNAPVGVPKKFVVVLTIKDSLNATSIDSLLISVNNTPPAVQITSPVHNSTYTPGIDTTYSFTASVTDAEHSSSQLKYEWQKSLRHNNHEHPGAIDTSPITAGAISRVGCNGELYYWFIKLTVTDDAGLSSADSAKIYPACPGGTLPLVLRKFSVTRQANINMVKWATEAAFQIKRFEIERSSNGFSFGVINGQTASINPGTNEYSYPDVDFQPGDNYYRLKMIEIGDVIRYSPLVKISSELRSENLVISPNPITGNFSVKYNALANGPVSIRIADMNGKLVGSLQEMVYRGPNLIYLQTQMSWTPGVYIITLQQGDVIQQAKFVKAE